MRRLYLLIVVTAVVAVALSVLSGRHDPPAAIVNTSVSTSATSSCTTTTKGSHQTTECSRTENVCLLPCGHPNPAPGTRIHEGCSQIPTDVGCEHRFLEDETTTRDCTRSEEWTVCTQTAYLTTRR